MPHSPSYRPHAHESAAIGRISRHRRHARYESTALPDPGTQAPFRAALGFAPANG